MLSHKMIEIVGDGTIFFHFNNIIDPNIFNWKDVCRYFTQQFITNVEIVGENKKLKIPTHNGIFQDHSYILKRIEEGHSFVISKFTNINNNLYDLYDEFCKIYPNKTIDFHLYAGLNKNSISFPAHNDLASNFIIQIDGECQWIIFKEHATREESENFVQKNESELTPSYVTILKPGDVLYIPGGKYHKCIPLTKRLSLSVPIL